MVGCGVFVFLDGLNLVAVSLFFQVLRLHNSSAWDLADLGQYAGSFVSMHACAGCCL